MSRIFHFGIIGLGSISELVHLPSIASLKEKGIELTAVCDISEVRARELAMKWGAKRYYTSYEEFVKKEKGIIDAVIIASPNACHKNQAIMAAEAGMHVLVEKPLACTNKEAWDIVKACRRSGVKLMVGCNYRFWLPNEIAKKIIDEGLIGNPIMGRSALHEGWNLYPEQIAVSRFRYDPKLAGAGALFDLGAHKVDLLTWFLNSLPKRVFGVAKRLATPENVTPLDDSVAIIIEYQNSSIGVVTLDRFSPVVSEVNEVYGTEGMLFTSTESGGPYRSVPLAFYTDKEYVWETCPEIIKKNRWPIFFWAEDLINKPMPKRWISIVPPREWSYTRMVNHFIECIKEDKEPKVKGEDGAWAMEVLCGVFKSMETQSWVDLPLKEEVIPPGYKPP